MKRFYSKIHIALLALGLGVAGVYFWNGMSVAWSEVAVELPQANADVLSVFPAVHEAEPKRRYVCDDQTDSTAHSTCIDRVVFEGRDLAFYDSGGVMGCGIELQKANARACEASYKNARAFVWKHWTQKNFAYIAVRRSSVDLRREWTTHLFIESDGEGKWRVVGRTIPMIVPEDRGEPGLDDLIEVKWEKASEWEERHLGIKRGTNFLRLYDLVGDSLTL